MVVRLLRRQDREKKMKPVRQVYTDGSCVNGMYGGYACLYLDTGEVLSGRAQLTNQQAELMAIELAVVNCEDGVDLKVFTDSAFSIGCFRGYNLEKSPHLEEIRNRVRKYAIEHHILVTLIKVKGHYDDQFNRTCDRLAQCEARKLQEEYK